MSFEVTPFFPNLISCGLFGISDESPAEYLSLDDKFIANKESTFIVRCTGESMSPYLMPGDYLIIDRSAKIRNGQVGAFYFNDQAICKYYIKENDKIILRSHHDDSPDLIVTEDDRLELFGVVQHIIRTVS